jgi:hypothetical protein
MPQIGERGTPPSKPKKKVVRRKPVTVATPDQQDRNRGVEPGGRATRPKVVRRKPAAKDSYRAPEEQQAISQAHSVRVQARAQSGDERRGTSPSGDRPQNRAKEMTTPKVAAGVKQARLRVLKKRGRGAGVRQVKAELEGRGALAKILHGAGEKIGQTSYSTGGGPAIALPHAGKHFGLTMATAGPRVVPVPKGSGPRKTLQDLVNFPAQVIPSVYVPTAGTVEAARGRPQRLKKFLSDLDKSDPIYNTVAAGVDALGGDSASAKKRIDAAWNAAKEHPGFTALELYGAKGAVGRAGGRVMRSGVVGKKAKAAGSTTRESRALPGTSLTEKRAYSPDVITKAGQVVAEKARRKVARKMNEHADRVKGENPDYADSLRARAEKINPTHVTEREIQKRVDEHVDAQETVRRQHRGEAVNATREMVKPVKHAGPITNLVTQGIVHADPADIRSYIKELEGEFDHLGPAGKRANKQLRQGLEKALTKVEKGKVDLADVKKVAADYHKTQADREAALAARGMLPTEEAQMAAAKPYAVRRMGAKWDEKAKQLLDKNGDPFTLDQIHAHMKAHGQEIPSYLSQAPNARGARNFFQSSSRAPGIDRTPRTGEATRGGTFDAALETLPEGAARQTGLRDAFDGFHAFLDEFAYKGKGGKIKTLGTRKQVEQAARDAMYDKNGDPVPGAVKFVPVRVNPFGGRAEQLAKMLEGTDSAAFEGAQHLRDAVESALKGEGDGPWALVPEAAAKRMQEHVRVLNPGNAGKVAQKVSGTFRKTVLATSIPWLTGNIVEGTGRAALARAGVRSYKIGKRVTKRAIELDKEKGERLSARTTGGGHFGSAERQAIHMNVDSMNPGVSRGLAKSLGAFWRAPGPKQAAGLWHGYTHAVFNVVNRFVEQKIQTAMLGKAIRDSGLMDGHLRKLSEEAVDQAARGALDVNTAADLGRAVDMMYGKYGKWSPDMRKAVALYTPFVAWTLNAAYFVLRTLPRDHPVATLLLASTERATEEWRKEHGLDKFIDGAVPAWLQGSIPGKGNVKYRAPMRYTPFGLFADPVGSATGAVLPQLSGVLAAGRGETWSGEKLKDQSDIGKAEAAAKSFVESTIPGLSLGGRVVSQGPKKAIVDTTIGRTAPKPKKRVTRSSSSGPGFGGGSSSGGGFVEPGGSGGFVGLGG